MLSHGANQKNLSLTIIKSIKISLPKKEEKIEIPIILKKLDLKINTQKNKKSIFESLFKTNLHELKTGEKRVMKISFEKIINREIS